MEYFANFDPNEGSTTGVVTITFPWKARRVVIINDSASYDLEYKLNNSESYGTLKPTETISLEVITPTIYLNSPSTNSVAYRVWGYG